MNLRYASARLCLLLSLLAGACQPAAGLPGTAAPFRPVHICYGAVAGSQIALWYAYEKGIFQKYGLEPEMTHISGTPNSAGAMLGGEVDLCINSGGQVINAVAAGEDLVLIETLYDRMLFELVVSPDIKAPADLVGESIAISLPGGLKDVAARLALEHLGLEPDTQVSLVTFRDNDEALMASGIENGSLAGAMLAPPLLARNKDAGMYVLLDVSTLDFAYERLGMVTTRRFISEHRDVVLAVVKASLDSIHAMQNDPDGAQAVLAKYLSLDPVADADDLASLYDIFVVRYLRKLPYPSEAGMQSVLQSVVVNNPSAASVTVEQAIDASLVREVEDSGFLDSLQP